MVTGELRELQALVSREDEDGALRLLLRLWEAHRSEAVAQAVQALSPRFLRRHPPLYTSQMWHKTARARDPASVEALLATPWRREHLRVLCSKLAVLAEFPPDPRLWAFAREVERQLGQDSSLRGAIEPARREVERNLARHGPPGEPARAGPRPDPFAGADLSLGRLERSLEEELLQHVFAAPDEDGPRYVYADYLLSKGDPLGPYLARSIRTGSGMEEAPYPLRMWWAKRLFGEIGLYILGFRRGFPSKAVLQSGQRALPTGAWATLEELTLGVSDRDWVAQVELPHLSVLNLGFYPLPPESWASWVGLWLARLRVHTLGVQWMHWQGAQLGRAELWPHLRTLRLTGHPPFGLGEATLGSLCQRALAVELVLQSYAWATPSSAAAMAHASRELEQIRRALDGAAPGVHRVGVRVGAVAVDFEREGSAAFHRLRLSGIRNADVPLLPSLLQTIPRAAVSRLEVACPPGSAAGFENRVRRALDRFGEDTLVFFRPPAP